MCGSGCYAFERTNHMPRNIVIGKLKYLIGPGLGTYHPTVSGCRVVVLVVEGGGHVPRNGKKGEMLRG